MTAVHTSLYPTTKEIYIDMLYTYECCEIGVSVQGERTKYGGCVLRVRDVDL